MSKLELKQVSEKKYIEVIEGKKTSFLQQPWWARFKQKVGHYSSEYYLIFKDGEPVGAFLCLVKSKKFFIVGLKTRYIPRPTFFFDTNDLLDRTLLETLFLRLKKLGLLTLVEPNYPHWDEGFISSQEFDELISYVAKRCHFVTSEATIQPRVTIIKSTLEDDLIASFPSRNARRNCKRGIKKARELGLEFLTRRRLSKNELIQAHSLISAIGGLKRFKTRSFEYFEELQNTMPNTIWFLFKDSRIRNRIILANLGILDEETSTYYDLYVGRDTNYDKVYISYLLKYYSFEYLKGCGIKYYDHWGIDLNKKSPKYNFSVFKSHFGGRMVTFPRQVIIGNKILTIFFRAFYSLLSF